MSLSRLFLGFMIASLAFADGSHILLHQRVDPFDITVFAPGERMTAAQTDLSVMVQNAADHSNVGNAQVTLRFQRKDAGKITEVVALATHARATNKLLYGAKVTLPSEGPWSFTAAVDAQGKNVVVGAALDAGPAEAPLQNRWALFIFVPVAIVLFIINRRLRRRWMPRHRPARP